jgi:hypothetical protein
VGHLGEQLELQEERLHKRGRLHAAAEQALEESNNKLSLTRARAKGLDIRLQLREKDLALAGLQLQQLRASRAGAAYLKARNSAAAPAPKPAAPAPTPATLQPGLLGPLEPQHNSAACDNKDSINPTTAAASEQPPEQLLKRAQAVTDSAGRSFCRDWACMGTCRYGDRCWYRHTHTLVAAYTLPVQALTPPPRQSA